MGIFSRTEEGVKPIAFVRNHTNLFENLRCDLARYLHDEGGFAAQKVSPWLRLTVRTLFRSEVQAIIIYRYGSWAYHIPLPETRPLRVIMRLWRGSHLTLHYIVSKFWLNISGIFIPAPARVGRGLFFPHPGPIYINTESVIGENATIYPCVVVGGDHSDDGAPIIGDNVVLGAGCKVLGPITVGHNVVVGANAVVIKNIPDESLAVGVPAVIKKRVYTQQHSDGCNELPADAPSGDADYLLPPAA